MGACVADITGRCVVLHRYLPQISIVPSFILITKQGTVLDSIYSMCLFTTSQTPSHAKILQITCFSKLGEICISHLNHSYRPITWAYQLQIYTRY